MKKIALVQVGNDESTTCYFKMIQKDCSGTADWYYYEEDILQEEFIQELKDLQENYDMILTGKPLPAHLDNQGIGDEDFTARAVVRYLESRFENFQGKHVVVIGRSTLLGRPIAKYLLDRDATVTVCHSRSGNLWRYLGDADAIVCAVGKPNFLNCYSIYVPVVDVGVNKVGDKYVGDCFNTENRDVFTGIGKMTRQILKEEIS